MEENNKISQDEENNLVNQVEFHNNKSEESNDDNSIWNLLLFIGALPFGFMIYPVVDAFFDGTGLMGGTNGGIFDALFTIFGYFIIYWFIYIPAIILIIVSIIKMSKNKSKK